VASSNIINSLSMPTHNLENNNLLLGNNAVYQLSVLSHDDSMYMSNTKYKSLYDEICEMKEKEENDKKFIKEFNEFVIKMMKESSKGNK
jgi:hypothetical protein